MYTVRQVARKTGVTVRTLHYYDEIGLLHPAATTEAGYRQYGHQELDRLGHICFFRSLDFSLEDIRRILDDPTFDSKGAMVHHRELLLLKRQRLDSLLEQIEDMLKGEKTMADFNVKQLREQQAQYAAEVQARWGNTAAYAESQQRDNQRSDEDLLGMAAGSQEIFKAFAQLIGNDPKAESVQALVKRWQDFITQHHYPCTKEILSCLGQMYTGDERFTAYLDKFGAGTAKLMSDGIAAYCDAP